jgi:hypothetical protein
MTARSSNFSKVAIGSGHMIDAPDRETPRFPETKAESVGMKIAERLAHWEIGTGDLALCGGACGADMLFGEECQRRGARLRLLLAQPVEEFVRNSVSHAGEEGAALPCLCEKAEVAISSRSDQRPDDISTARTNL